VNRSQEFVGNHLLGKLSPQFFHHPCDGGVPRNRALQPRRENKVCDQNHDLLESWIPSSGNFFCDLPHDPLGDQFQGSAYHHHLDRKSLVIISPEFHQSIFSYSKAALF